LQPFRRVVRDAVADEAPAGDLVDGETARDVTRDALVPLELPARAIRSVASDDVALPAFKDDALARSPAGIEAVGVQ
jgi:hypothetical protein